MSGDLIRQRAYEVIAIVTLSKDRVMGGKQLTLFANNEVEQKNMSNELAVTLGGDVIKLKFGDYLIVRE